MRGVGAIILAGGASLRMGKDKRYLKYQGQTFLDRALALVKDCDSVLLSVREPLDHPAKQVFDKEQGQGPLVGLLSCLEQSDSEKNLVIGVDFPFLDRSILNSLVQESTEVQILVSRCVGQLQPLVGRYNKSILPELEGYIKRGGRSFMGLLDELDHHVFDFEPDQKNKFANINTPEDLIKWEKYAEA